MWLHIINGSVIAVLTIIFTALGFQYFNWVLEGGIHTPLGGGVFIVMFLVMALGFVAKDKMNKVKFNTPSVLTYKQAHKFLGYLLLIAG